MIFRQWQQVLDGTKTQTRRPVKPGQEGNHWDIETDVINEVIQWLDNGKEYPGNMRSLYAVGYTLAVQPGRGEKAVGRIWITKIRRERLGDISEEDCLAEGIYLLREDYEWTYTWPGREKEGPHYFGRAKWAYADLWNHVGGNWERDKDKDVWVLDFEVVKT